MSAPATLRGRNEPPENRLESWKEIAAYLNRGTRTVQRWEKTENLPVHRHLHDKQGTVYAFRTELDAWWQGRTVRLQSFDSPSEAPAAADSPAGSKWNLPVLVLTVVGAAVVYLLWPTTPEWRLGRSAPFTNTPGYETHAAFSPDGAQVAWSAAEVDSNGSEIFVGPVAAGNPLQLTTHPAHDLQPAWSPDGIHIAWVRTRREGNAQVLVKPASGGAERAVTDLIFGGQTHPYVQWTRDPRWIIVASRPAHHKQTSLFRVSVETGETVRITSPPESSLGDSGIAISPDGRTLVFLRADRPDSHDLWMIELTRDALPAGEARRLTYYGGPVGAPYWIPGTDEVAFAVMSDFAPGWNRIAARGGRARPLHALDSRRSPVAFSPDGSQMIVTEHSEDHNIRRLDLATGVDREVVVSTRIDTNPSISPDGEWIAFASDRRGSMDIWKARSDGSQCVRLANFPGKSAGSPRWSPDGTSIAFDLADASDADIYVMAPDGGRLRRLTHEGARDFVPSWSSDSEWIYFGSDRGGTTQIWKIPAAGGNAVQVTRFGGFAAFESADAGWLYVLKDGNKKTGPGSGIWRVSIADGKEERISNARADWSRLAVTSKGLMYISSDGDDRSYVHLYDPVSRFSRSLLPLRKAAAMGFAVAPGEHWLAYTAIERRGADLVLIDIER